MEEHRDVLRLRSPDHRYWEGDLVSHLRRWVYEHSDIPAETDAKEALIDSLKRKVMNEPSEVPRIPGILDHDALDDVRSTGWWETLHRLEESLGEPVVPTTLGRFNSSTIRMLVLRGYMHTYLASLAIRPWDYRDLDGAAAHIAERIISLGLP